MKDLLLFAPLLWIRKILLYILFIAIALGILVYFLANSPWVIKKVADTFAPDYNISYSRIYGNVLTGVEIEDIKYTTQPLAKHLTLKWNPNGLVQKKIIVNHLVVHNANVDTIKALIASFPSDDNKSSEPFAFSVNVKKLSIDLLPFSQEGMAVESVTLNADNIDYKNDIISVLKMDASIDSNISEVLLKAQAFEPLKIYHIVLNATNSSINLKKLVFEKGFLDLNVTSNLSNLFYRGKVDNNQLLGKVNLLPQEELFTLYTLPIRRESIGDVDIDLDASKERIIAKIDANATQLLKADEGAFNLDIHSLNSTVSYGFDDAKLIADTHIRLNTPYGKDILVTNLLTLDDGLSYTGDINLKQLIGIDTKFTKPINDLKVSYEGNDSSINAEIRSSMLRGNFHSPDFKMANLHLESKETLLLRDYIELPIELNATRLHMTLDAPISFDDNASYMAVAKVRSNVVNIDTNISYTTHLYATSQIEIPKASLLKSYSEALKWENFSSFQVEASLKNNDVDVNLVSKHLSSVLHYDLNSTKVDGKIHLAGLDTTLLGVVKEKIILSSKIGSIPVLLKSVGEIYSVENLPNIDGSAKLKVTVDALKKANIEFSSSHIAYHVNHLSTQEVDDIDLLLTLEEDKVVLERYTLRYEKEKIFSTKPSTLALKGDLVSLLPLWINDQLRTEGDYDLKTKKGKIVAKAESLHISHELIDLDTKVDIVTKRDGNKTSVHGVVTLLGGDVHYDMSQKTFASDSDIVIVQDIKEEEESTFMDNLSIDVQVKTKNPLVYNKDVINIKASVDLGIHKVENAELLVLGTVKIDKGGTYIFQNKKFVLDTSFIHFTGNPDKPLLDIKVLYKALNHKVTMKITGSAQMPQIDFSSKPRLSKAEILSLILFDTIEGAGTNNGNEMMKMMGGAMAKSALNDMGVKIDHLVLGEGNSVEVGKKLTNKMTIIYVNDTVASVKLKYEHGKNTESVIGMSEESQSYDIIYKKDF